MQSTLSLDLARRLDQRELDEHVSKIVGEFTEECIRDPFFFIQRCLGYKLENFHRDWFNHQLAHPKTVLLGPRGHGKSSVAHISFVLWRLLADQDIRCLIVSKSEAQAQLFLSEIKTHMARNAMLRAVFGTDRMTPDRWNMSTVLLPRERIAKEPTITAKGMGTSLPSWHFDLIIADDLHDLANSRTPGQREVVWRWFEQVMLPTLEPHGELHVIGTRWHPDDIYGRLIAKGQAALEAGEESEAYYPLESRAIIAEDPDPEKCVVLWPEYMPYSKLCAIRREQGSVIFSLQYQCVASGDTMAGGIFRHDDLRILNERPEDARKRCVYVAQGWDLATEGKDLKGEVVGEEIRTNYTACVTVGLTRDNEFIVLDWYRGRPGLIGQVEAVEAQAAKWDPDAVVMESVAYQNILTQYVRKSTTLPIIPARPKKDKVARAWRLQPYVEERRVWIPVAHLGLRDILSSFPMGEEDDSVDAWMHAMDRVVMYERGQQVNANRNGLGFQRRGM